MSLPRERADKELLKFIETSDGKVALRLKLHDDSFTVLDARYVQTTTTGNYVEIAGDTMTGALDIEPTGATSLTIKKDTKFYLDGG